MNSIMRFFSSVLYSNGMNLMSHLAQEGKNAAVDKLLREGGKPEDAMYGYALAGNDDQVARMFAIIESSDKSKLPVCTGQLIRGYARSGYFNKIYALSHYNDYPADFMIGIAQAGDRDRVTQLLDRNITLFGSAVEGYASANHGHFLGKLIRGTVFYPEAIYQAARAGHVALVNDLLRQCGIEASEHIDASLTGDFPDRPASFVEINVYSYLNNAVKGYMTGLHFSDAIALLARGASIRLCITELKDSEGLPSKELYVAFLAHIQDALLRAKVLKHMQLDGHVMSNLTITEADTKELDTTIACMEHEHLNYIEARAKMEEPAHSGVPGDLSLIYFSRGL